MYEASIHLLCLNTASKCCQTFTTYPLPCRSLDYLNPLTLSPTSFFFPSSSSPILIPRISLPYIRLASPIIYPHFSFRSSLLYLALNFLIMESQDQVNTLGDGLRHLRMRDADELVKYAIPTENVPRPGFNNTGKEVEVSMNAFGITKYPSRTVYQYDVSQTLRTCRARGSVSIILIEIRSTSEMVPRRLPLSRRFGARMRARTRFARPFSMDRSLHGAYWTSPLPTSFYSLY